MTVEDFLSHTDYCFDSFDIIQKSPYRRIETLSFASDVIASYGNEDVVSWNPSASVDGYGDPFIILEIELP